MIKLLLFTLITVLGDSQGGIVSHILKKHNYQILDLHIDGVRTQRVCTTVMKRIPSSEFIIIFLGSNHYDDMSPPNVSCVLEQLPKNSKCFWVGPPLIRGKKYKNEEELKSRVSSQCFYISMQDIKDLPDGVHPSGESAEKMTSKIILHLR